MEERNYVEELCGIPYNPPQYSPGVNYDEELYKTDIDWKKVLGEVFVTKREDLISRRKAGVKWKEQFELRKEGLPSPAVEENEKNENLKSGFWNFTKERIMCIGIAVCMGVLVLLSK